MADPERSSKREAYQRHWLEQVCRGLALTPAQRLAWLESTMSELADWVGRARLGRPMAEDTPPTTGDGTD